VTFEGTHFSLADVALGLLALGYLVTLIKDYRPIKALRAENIELRKTFADLQDRYNETTAQLADALKKIEVLEQKTDFSANFSVVHELIKSGTERMLHDHEKILSAITEHGREEKEVWVEVNRGLAANTAVLSTLSAGLTAQLLPTEVSGQSSGARSQDE